MRWRMRSAVGLILALLAVTACAERGPDASESEIIGTWTGAGGAVLALETGGAFTATKLPLQLQAPTFFSQPVTGRGTWKLIPTGQYQRQHVEMTLADFATSFDVLASGKKYRLFLWIGDPDDDQAYWMDKQ